MSPHKKISRNFLKIFTEIENKYLTTCYNTHLIWNIKQSNITATGWVISENKLRKRPNSACASSAALYNNGVADCLLGCLYAGRQRAQASPEEGTREEKTRTKLTSMRSTLTTYHDLCRDWKLQPEDANRQNTFFIFT